MWCILIGVGLCVVVIGIGIFLAIYLTSNENYSCGQEVISGTGFSKKCGHAKHNEICTVECDIGYSGYPRDCVCKNGKWKCPNPSPMCIRAKRTDILMPCISEILSGKGYKTECKLAHHNEKCTVSCTTGYFGNSQEFLCTNGVWKGVNPTCSKFSPREIQSHMEKFPGLPIKNGSGSDCFLITALNLLWNTPLKEKCKEDAEEYTKSPTMKTVCLTFAEQDIHTRAINVKTITNELELNKWKENDKTQKDKLLEHGGLTVKGQGKVVIRFTSADEDEPVRFLLTDLSGDPHPYLIDAGIPLAEINFTNNQIIQINPTIGNVRTIDSIEFICHTYHDAQEIALKILSNESTNAVGELALFVGDIFDTSNISLDHDAENSCTRPIQFGETTKYLNLYPDLHREIFFIELPGNNIGDNIASTLTINIGTTFEYTLVGMTVYAGKNHYFSYLNDINAKNTDQAWIRVDDSHAEFIGSFNDVVENLFMRKSSFPRSLMYQKKKNVAIN